MKIAVTSTGKTLSDRMDQRFGRAAYFLVVDPESMDFEVVENAQNLNRPQGAGIQAGKIIADNRVDMLITGNCGPKAFDVLNQAGIKILTGASGTVNDAINSFRNGELVATNGPNVEGHWV